MQLEDIPSHRTPRSIPPKLHDEVWRLNGEGLTTGQIAQALAASGCITTRHSVRRLLTQLSLANARDAHGAAMADELKQARDTALSLRQMHEDELSDLCDDLFIAARKEQLDQVLALSRAGRILLRTVDHYDRVYRDALEREAKLPVPERRITTPEGVPTITSPVEGEELKPYQFYPNGVGVPGTVVAITYDDVPMYPKTCSPSLGQWFSETFQARPGKHKMTVRYFGSQLRSEVNFTILGCLLFLSLAHLSCGRTTPAGTTGTGPGQSAISAQKGSSHPRRPAPADRPVRPRVPEARPFSVRSVGKLEGERHNLRHPADLMHATARLPPLTSPRESPRACPGVPVTARTIPFIALATLGLVTFGCGGTHSGFPIGHACLANPDCASNRCDTSFSGGYCVDSCGANNSCPSGASCIRSTTNAGAECLQSCTRNADCRLGYVCDTTQSVCLTPVQGTATGCRARGCPSGQLCDTTTDQCMNGSSNPGGTGTGAGAPCAQDSQCPGAAQPICITASENFPGGYCSAQCASNSDCGPNGTCVSGLFQGSNGSAVSGCLESCSSNSMCRAGYFCDQGTCLPHDCRIDSTICSAGQTCDTSNGQCGTVSHTGPSAVALSGCPGTGYSAQVRFGNASAVYKLSLDSGSSTTAVADTQCGSCGNVTPLYPESGQNTGQPQSSQYADGSGWSGTIFRDSATIVGGPGSVQLAFVAIDQQNGFFHNMDCQLNQTSTSPNEGIMGLGPDDLLLQGTGSVVDNIVTTRMVGDLFAVQLCSQGGNLWVGGFDTGAMSAAPQYSPILSMDQSNPYYSVEVRNMSFGGTSVGSTNNLGTVMVDTGTSLLVLPSSVFQALTSAITSNAAFGSAFQGMGSSLFSGGSACVGANATPAQLDATLPPLSLTFAGENGGTFTLQAPATKSYLYPVNTGQGTVYCGGLMDLGSEGQTIMGDTLLAAFVEIFDIKNNRIGFAPSQGCP